MTKNELNRLWRRCVLKDQEAREELKDCHRRGEMTLRYRSLAKDAAKLKAEYEKAASGSVSNPLSVKHNEVFMRQKVVGDIMGRSGPDTHHSIIGTFERKYK